jgi:hypothetical protein
MFTHSDSTPVLLALPAQQSIRWGTDALDCWLLAWWRNKQ